MAQKLKEISLRTADIILRKPDRRIRFNPTPPNPGTISFDNHPLIQSFISFSKQLINKNNETDLAQKMIAPETFQKTAKENGFHGFISTPKAYIDSFGKWKDYRNGVAENQWSVFNLNAPIAHFLRAGSAPPFPLVPTKIQRTVIPRLLQSKNVFFHSPTGSGKTFAYLLPAFQLLSSINISGFEIIVLASSNGLASQIHGEARRFISAEHCALLTSFEPLDVQMRRLNKDRPAVIVSTPTRLSEIIKAPRLIPRANVQFMVFDEVDLTFRSLLAVRKKGVVKEKPAVGLLKHFNSNHLQIAACSATKSESLLSKLDLEINSKRGVEIKKIETVSVDTAQTKSGVEHLFRVGYFLDFAKRLNLFVESFTAENPRSALLIVPEQSINLVKLVSALKRRSISAAILNESESEAVRGETLEKFRTRRIKLGVTNEYYHRGLDFDFITHVFVWDVRKDLNLCDLYVHMHGRLARPSKEIPFLQQAGRCITIVDYSDLAKLKEIEEKLGITFESIVNR